MSRFREWLKLSIADAPKKRNLAVIPVAALVTIDHAA
jgi:hypothetical protein